MNVPRLTEAEMRAAREAAFRVYDTDSKVTKRIVAQATQQERHVDEITRGRRPTRRNRWPSPEERVAEWPTDEEMPALLRGLEPRTWQLILFWLYYEGLPKAEIADRLGYSRVQVWRIVPQALARLKEMQQ